MTRWWWRRRKVKQYITAAEMEVNKNDFGFDIVFRSDAQLFLIFSKIYHKIYKYTSENKLVP